MRCKYPDRDLSQRLDQTICRYDEFPYYVRYAGKNTLYLYKIGDRNGQVVKSIDAKDEKFDVSSIPLGYFQVNKSRVAYASRRPNRMYKQGVSADNLQTTLILGSSPMMMPTIYCQGFEDMILNNYPDVDTAINTLRNKEQDTEVAISRDTALQWNSGLKLIFVYFKEEQVGWIVPDTKIVIVKSYELAWIVSVHLSSFKWEVQ